jgi:hypothetical protein
MMMMMINSETFIGVADILLLLSRVVVVITVMMIKIMIIIIIIIVVIIIIIITVITATAVQCHQYLTVFLSAELRAEKESLDKIKPDSPCIYVRAYTDEYILIIENGSHCEESLLKRRFVQKKTNSLRRRRKNYYILNKYLFF